MDPRKGQSAYGGGREHIGRRSRDERRSLSESLADGTSKFFSSMVAKKNGIFNDLSSKIETTFATKTDSVSNSIDEPFSPNVSATPNIPPPRPPPPKRLPSVGSTREKENVMKRMASMPAYTRTNSKPEFVPDVPPLSRGLITNHKGASSEERFSVNGMNVSFDEPIYGNQRRESAFSQPVTDIPVSDEMSSDTQHSTARRASGSSSSVPQPKPVPRSQKPARAVDNSAVSTQPNDRSHSGFDQPKRSGDPNGQRSSQTNSPQTVLSDRRNPDADKSNHRPEIVDSNKLAEEKSMLADRSARNAGSDKKSNAKNAALEGSEDPSSKQKAPKFTTTKRRSSTVDEMLFDDYIEPDVNAVISQEAPPEDLICFEPDSEAEHVANSSDSSSEGNSRKIAGTSVDSSDVEYGSAQIQRSASVGSEKSWSSNYSVDSQPDDVTLECMEFMKSFVDKVFHNGEDIAQTEKAKFGELCQVIREQLTRVTRAEFPKCIFPEGYGSQDTSIHSDDISSDAIVFVLVGNRKYYQTDRLISFTLNIIFMRVHNKKVTEVIFFRLMQYFAVCLFECNEAEDFSPAKTLMNMCFTFYHEAPAAQGQTEKVFLYMYMRDQPIWQSLRFWNAAYFDAVQCERSRRPMPTNSDENETVSDDKQFQENITFGQLGTFACNMRAFGLNKELCLEFLRKQSTIANLRGDQVKLLRDNIEKVKDT